MGRRWVGWPLEKWPNMGCADVGLWPPLLQIIFQNKGLWVRLTWVCDTHVSQGKGLLIFTIWIPPCWKFETHIERPRDAMKQCDCHYQLLANDNGHDFNGKTWCYRQLKVSYCVHMRTPLADNVTSDIWLIMLPATWARVDTNEAYTIIWMKCTFNTSYFSF